MASFAETSGSPTWSVDFDVAVGSIGGGAPVAFSERVIPGGTDRFIDVAGAQAERVALSIFFAAADVANYATLKSYRGRIGTLTSPVGVDGGSTSALLIDVSPGDVAPLGELHATATFLLT